MTEEQKRNIRECLESQGMDPDLVKRTMWHIEREEAAKLIRDTIDGTHNINPQELNMGPDTTENINEISEEDRMNLEAGWYSIPRETQTQDDTNLLKKSMPLALDSSKILGMKKTDDDPTQDVMLYQDMMWYFDPESQRFKPVIEHETEGLQGKDKQCNRIVSSPGTEKKINIKDYCDKMSNKKHTACPDPVFTDECVWYALNRDDNQPHSPVPSLKNITPGQWDKMTENKITEAMISDARDTTNPFTYSQILTRMHKTHERKNHDYGDAAYQGYKKFGPTYFLVQLHNKLSRLESLTAPGTEIQVKDESIDDTLLDLANYAVMYLESRHRYD